jgi:hypothetical protein
VAELSNEEGTGGVFEIEVVRHLFVATLSSYAWCGEYRHVVVGCHLGSKLRIMLEVPIVKVAQGCRHEYLEPQLKEIALGSIRILFLVFFPGPVQLEETTKHTRVGTVDHGDNWKVALGFGLGDHLLDQAVGEIGHHGQSYEGRATLVRVPFVLHIACHSYTSLEVLQGTYRRAMSGRDVV